MNSAKIDISFNKATAKDIQNHLTECDLYFEPKLSSRVDLSEYSDKIYRLAHRFEAWSGKSLVGLVALYLDEEKKNGFITNVSVSSRFSNKGIGSNLILDCVRFARLNHLEFLSLEVSIKSNIAISLYEKYGFELGEKGATMAKMTLQLE